MTVGEPLSWHHQAEITQALAGFKRGEGPHTLSDLSFANVYLFRQAHQYRYLGGAWPCLQGVAYDGQRTVLPLFDVAQAPRPVLQALQGEAGAVFFPVAESQLRGLSAAQCQWHASRDDADYVYPADQFRQYAGSGLHSKRNLVRQLLDAGEVRATPYSVDLVTEAQRVLHDWMRVKGKPAGDADELPCLEALQHADRLGLQGYLYHVQNQVAGFVLAESLAPGVWVMRFAKGMDHFKGIYQYMFQHVCLATPTLQWLNFEQDLGLPNLRQTKLSYQPALLLPKYRLRLSHLAQDSMSQPA